MSKIDRTTLIPIGVVGSVLVTVFYVTVIVVGNFSDLKAAVKTQNEVTRLHRAEIKELSHSISKLSSEVARLNEAVTNLKGRK